MPISSCTGAAWRDGVFGTEFVETLGALTGADVAASDDLTGSAFLGGDWDLEVVTGEINTAKLFSASSAVDFPHVLANIIKVQKGLWDTPTDGDDEYVFHPNWGTITINKRVSVPNPYNLDPPPMAKNGGKDTLDFNLITASPENCYRQW